MRKLLYLCFMLIGLVSCSKAEFRDYLYIDEGKVISLEDKASIGIYSNSNAVRKYKVESFYDRFKKDDLKIGDNVYVYRDKDGVFVTKFSVKEGKIVNDYFSKCFWDNLISLKSILAIVVVSFFLVWWVVYSNKKGYKEGEQIGISLILFSLLSVPLFINKVDHKLYYIENGEVTEIEDNMMELNGVSYYFLGETRDIATGNQLCIGDSIFLYSDMILIFGSDESIYASSVYIDEEVTNHGNTYPNAYLITLMINVLVCVFWIIVFNIPVVKNLFENKKEIV